MVPALRGVQALGGKPRVAHHQTGQPGGGPLVLAGTGKVHPHGAVKIIRMIGVFLGIVPVLVVVEGVSGDLYSIHILDSGIGIDQINDGLPAGPQLQAQGVLSPLTHNIDSPGISLPVVDHRAVQAEAGPVQRPGHRVCTPQDVDDLLGGQQLYKPALRVSIIPRHSVRAGAVGVVIDGLIGEVVRLSPKGVLHHQGVISLPSRLLTHLRRGRHPRRGVRPGQISPLPQLPAPYRRNQTAGRQNACRQSGTGPPGPLSLQHLVRQGCRGGNAVHIISISVHSCSPFSSAPSFALARVSRERTVPSRQPVIAAISAVWYPS